MKIAYQFAWQENLTQAGEGVPVKYGAKEDEAAVHALADRTIAAFLESPLAKPKGDVLGIEEELRIVLHRHDAGMKNIILLSLPELAETLKLPQEWLKAEADAGRIPHLKIGKRYRFDANAVAEVLLARARQTGEVSHG